MKKHLIALLAIVFCASPIFAKSPSDVKRTAYCKINKNRIMIFQFSGLPSSEEMLGYLKKNQPMNTDRRMTAAYFFPKGSVMPQSGFSSCSSIFQANKFLYEKMDINPWGFAYMIGFNGARTFVNCMESPKHDLCRQ